MIIHVIKYSKIRGSVASVPTSPTCNGWLAFPVGSSGRCAAGVDAGAASAAGASATSRKAMGSKGYTPPEPP